ncbi:MAG: lysozyme inhibitor LprI family protein, partial [Nanoarchaeota archaeon]
MNKVIVVISILFLLNPLGALGQEEHPIDQSLEECLQKSQCVTARMKACLEEAKTQWENELNKYYNLLMVVLKKEDRKKLQKSQLAWERFKNLEYVFIPEYFLEFGSYVGVAIRDQKVEIVRARALQLKQYYETLDVEGCFVKVSPDNKKVIFVKHIKKDPSTSETGWMPSDFDEVWAMDIDGSNKRCIIKNNYKSVSKNDGWDNYLGSFGSLQFSPDAKKIYFLCQNCVTTAILYSADVNGKGIKKLRYAHGIDGLVGGNSNAEYYGYLVVHVRKFPEDSHTTKWTTVLIDPEGNEIKEIEDQDSFWKE